MTSCSVLRPGDSHHRFCREGSPQRRDSMAELTIDDDGLNKTQRLQISNNGNDVRG